MILRARADSLELSSEETGWTLVVETDEGDTLVLNIHGAAYELAGSQALRNLILWRVEADDARASSASTRHRMCHVDESGGVRGDS